MHKWPHRSAENVFLEAQLLYNYIGVRYPLTGRLSLSTSPLFVEPFGRSLRFCHIEFYKEAIYDVVYRQFSDLNIFFSLTWKFDGDSKSDIAFSPNKCPDHNSPISFIMERFEYFFFFDLEIWWGFQIRYFELFMNVVILLIIKFAGHGQETKIQQSN